MPTHLKLLTDEDALRWPHQCARCGTEERLRNAETSIVAPPPRRDQTGAGSIGSNVVSVDYPVCARHARALASAQWLSGSGAGPRSARLLAWLVVAAGLYALLRLLLQDGAEAPSWLLGLAVAATLLPPLAILWAYRATPVRLTRLDSDAITISFGSEPYARAFAEANARLLVRARPAAAPTAGASS